MMNKMINVLISDDCKTDLETEHEIICDAFKKINITYNIDCYSESKEIKNSDKIYDIAFLDIEMSDLNGLDIAKYLLKKNKKCIIIFITNYSVYLDSAFDVNAFRFLPKPLDKERLYSGVEKAIKKMKDDEKVIYVTERANKNIVTIKVKSILFIENSNRHTRIVTEGNDFIAAETFSAIKNMIDTDVDYFASPHNSILVNLRYVISHDKSSVYVLKNNKKIVLNMSRRHYSEFVNKLFAMAEQMQ